MDHLAPRTESSDDVLSCAIITIPANELLTEIHNPKQRMPLILPPEAVDIWLTGTPEQATDLLVPYPSELMRAHRVSKRVNKPENDLPGADGAGCAGNRTARVAAQLASPLWQPRRLARFPGFQFARSPPDLPATASRTRATDPIPEVRWSADFRPPRAPIVRG